MVKVNLIAHDVSDVSSGGGVVNLQRRCGEETFCILEVESLYLDHVTSLTNRKASKRAILDYADCKRVWKRVKELQVGF